jgi:LysM repeat protein
MQDYTIQKGDYLGKIAKDAEISLRDLLKINPQIKDPNKIMPGEKIKLPSSYAPPPKFDDEGEFAQESYEDRIVEFFGHYIAAKVMLPNSKKAKRMASALANELSSEYRQGKMPDGEGKQFFSGFTILKQLANSLGGKYGSESSMGRYLTNNEVRPIEVKGYKVSRSDYQFFADAWQRVSMSEYGYTGKETSLTGKPMASVASAGNIFENYFKQNLKEEDISTSDSEVSELADIVVDEINAVFSQLPDGSPLKSREVALAALEQIKNALPGMIQGMNVA